MTTTQFMTEDTSTIKQFSDHNDDLNFVADIIEGFTSDDPNVRQQAVLKADKLMQHGNVSEIPHIKSKVVAEHGDGHGDEFNSLNVAHFLQDLSIKDIQQRKLTRFERKQKSDELRKLGNLSFANKDYQTAVDYYSRAIDLTRDSAYLYTNRALAHITLGFYKEAVTDCDRAIFIAEFSLKARLYKAKALYLQGETTLSFANLKETKQILPDHMAAIDYFEKTLREASQQHDKASDDTFLHEKFMRLAAQFDVENMNDFFTKNNSI